ncbi:restriction endonuclease subunit S [Arenibacter algicola]|uniref:restriction endonuclease subunit S n=1 Tax=Arenibacter algicola TaxID=616991 RepID=UPI0005540963|nr:restriction endonuclease subunit S [Arenibacter algicola]
MIATEKENKIVNWSEVLTIKNGKNQRKVENPKGKYPIYGSGGVMGYADDYICDEHTVIIGRKGSINKPLYILEKFWNVDTAFGLVAGKNLSSKYLYYFCIQYDFLRHNKATTIPSLTKADLLKVEIPLPPLETQKRIAQILDEACALRDKTQQLLKEYDLLAQSIFLEMFGDPAINQKGWEMKEFGDVGKLDRGKSKHRPRNAPELLGGIYPLIQTGDVANSNGRIEEYTSTYSEIGLAQSKMWPKGTLCITVAANIAKTGILTMDACFPDSVVGFIPNEHTNNEFTLFWMSFLQKIIEANAPQAAQKNINLKILKELKFFCPPINLQNQFAEKIALIEKQKDLAKQELKESKELFNCLLQKAFKGELVN